MQKNHKILGFILLIILALTFWYFWSTGVETKTPVVTEDSALSANSTEKNNEEFQELAFPNNPLNIENWQTYTNESLGFTLKYPEDWEVFDDTDRYQRFIIWPKSRVKMDDRGVYMEIRDETLEEYLEDLEDNSHIKYIRKFQHQSVMGAAFETEFKHYAISAGDKVYYFYCPSVDDGFDLVLEQVVLSFKFL